MSFPAFFREAPKLLVRDPLAAFLGAATDGIIEYHYSHAVRLAGHSCPAVAGAYLMVLNGLEALYDGDLPERGSIDVVMRDERNHYTTGVLASVATLLTGAAPETGFQGIGSTGRFRRKDLLRFGAEIEGTLSMRRRDTGREVVVDINTDVVPHAPAMSELLPKAVSGRASALELAEFGVLWQDRVRRMLLEHADDPKLVHVYDGSGNDGHLGAILAG